MGEGTDRNVSRDTSTWKTESIMDSKQVVQVGVDR